MPNDDDNLPPALTGHVPLLLSILIGASLWVYYFTNWFPLFGSVLGLGGVLIVVPALRGLMAESRRMAYASLVDRILFQKPGTARLYLVLLLIGLVFGIVFVQPLSISAPTGAQPMEIRVILVSANGDERLHLARLEPGSTQAMPLWQPFVGGPREIRVVADGLPRINRRIGSFDWLRLSLPGDFWSRPVVLLRAEPGLIRDLQNLKPILKIEHQPKDGTATECIVEERYLGEPVWLGGGEDMINVSESMRRQWLQEARMFGARNAQPKLWEVIATIPTRAHCIHTLDIGDLIVWTLVSAGQAKDVLASSSAEIRSDIFYPQEILLRREDME